jgi:hypothetical protein
MLPHLSCNFKVKQNKSPYGRRVTGKHTNIYWNFLRKNFCGWISAFLNGMGCMCLYRDNVFSTFYNIGKISLLFLWSDTWIVSGKFCSACQCVIQFLIEAKKWQLCLTLSVDALYKSSVSESSSAASWSVSLDVLIELWYRHPSLSAVNLFQKNTALKKGVSSI